MKLRRETWQEQKKYQPTIVNRDVAVKSLICFFDKQQNCFLTMVINIMAVDSSISQHAHTAKMK